MVERLLITDDKRMQCAALLHVKDGTITAPTVILTTGTFLNGLIHIGKNNYSAGRQGEEAVPSSFRISCITWINVGRLKTGTPPRLLRSSIDFSKLEFQQPDNLNHLFEFYPHEVKNSRDCYIAYTNETTHEIIRNNLASFCNV